MGATTEAHQQPSEEYRASSLKKPLTLRRRNLRLSLELDGSVRFLESMSERRLLFGREQISLYRGKAGILLPAQRPEWRLRLTPYQSSFSATVFDSIECTVSIGILPRSAEGYYRSVTFRNRGVAPAKLRMMCLQDPTAAHFRDSQFAWGSLGVNAFNRSTHVALDEVASPPSARVLGSKPGPKLIYMTTDRGKAAELTAAGELPEQTAGMTGQVLVLSQYDLEILAGSEVGLSMLAVYDQSRLETALSNFDRLIESEPEEEGPEFDVASSSPSLSAAAKWAVSALEGACYEPDSLDRHEVLRSLPFVDPASAKAIIENAKNGISSDGSVGHTLDPAKPGLLETAALLEGCCMLGTLSSEKKYARSAYSTARRLAGYLRSSSPGGVVKTDSSLPQGWRRRIGKGYPTGEIPEVSLAVASALKAASNLATRVRKPEEAARWEESSRLIIHAVKERAIDEHGVLSLSLEGDRMRTDETVDQAVACYRFSLGSDLESHVVRRLLEKDFECGWGPRTIPTSNRTYFNPSYGEGQLGGYWTRSALAHTITAYRAGLSGIGSIELESIARLPASEAPKLGGAPGEFPYWIDPQRRETHGQGSDPVSASRFLEALIRCEVGLEFGSRGLEVKPSNGSRLKWLLIAGLYAGRRANVFIGRAAGSSFAFVGLPDCRVENGSAFSGSELATADESGLAAASFFTPGQTICVGNSSDASVKSKVSFRARDPSLTRHLSVKLERFDPKTGSWESFSSVRVLSPMSFELSLGALDWGAFRLSTGS